MTPFEPYESLAISEIAKHECSPNPIQSALELVGKPIAKVLEVAHQSKNKYIRKAVSSIDTTIEKSLKATIKGANLLTGEDVVRKAYMKKHNIQITDINTVKQLPLQQMDSVADSFDFSNGFFVTTEGAVLGAATTLLEAVPLAQIAIPAVVTADVAASMTLMSRHVCQIATSYGYSSRDAANVPHILSAMVSTSSSSDEGFLVTKAAAISEIRAATHFAANHAGSLSGSVVKDSVSPQLVKLVQFVTERLGMIITEKELGMLVPIAGAVLNGGLNLAFQQMNHTNAKDYFRRLILTDKYGEDAVTAAIQLEKDKLNARTAI
ncbi:EcsC family protein [Paenibacillus thalictri]|uniref:EcsC family protein n=1 Tax=Paenibacillus thalictri TaxID=2527873 RepID=A0A4Q9DN44_9BACL|nr:EcsC family protein [Paenibacillus thalictri]TBL75160.1 hypothetical protein EYB31_24465 [Paenibacillus thalictri]